MWHVQGKSNRFEGYQCTRECYSKAVDPKCSQVAPYAGMKKPKAPQLTARERLAQRLRAERAVRGLSQEELAFLAGVHRTYMGSVERAERNVSIDNIEQFAVALGMDICELLKPV